MDGATEKLELGLLRLAKAGDDNDLLALALQSLHGALEDHFRAHLAADSNIPAEQRAAFQDPKKVQWKELLDAMQLHADLNTQDRELIWRTNALRTKVAHGGRYTGTRADLERYAALVQSLCGYTPPEKPARPAEKPARPAEKPARAAANKPSPPTSPRPATPPDDIPRAIRTKAPAAPPRLRSRWPGGLIALALLAGLALFVALRSVTPRADSAATPTNVATATVEASSDPVPTTNAPPTPQPRQATVNAPDGLNLRSDHSNTATVLSALPDGTRVTIIDGPIQADGRSWWSVEQGAQHGWCAGEFLTFDRT